MSLRLIPKGTFQPVIPRRPSTSSFYLTTVQPLPAHSKDSTAQTSAQAALSPAATASNGNLNKNSSNSTNNKRKKDGLKPIITTDGPG
ncbi:hypothetical protein NEUTE1DRAFT_149910 [Neurospora tetrasperma FGSC 2508]|uniref:Uncharacterized protein n=1 Tax=Neurospora tetrasperma (strain FGSC 2508 / ATCC MYA-4615 / P0657) TaxID=510951 RepID=F8N1T4_NEUT8|nr:uncharacterized protein NEUTE1DRAFT_149910 [Neurospora tetrasperma FGSC 2508]EGO52361.1 hypothetical protein NEUTE1DRAFT_149910 [Neurospora tetrasperma FGSC 2508]